MQLRLIMQNKNEGWVSIHRKIRKHPLWTHDRFSMGQAWVDLILRANYSERGMVYNSEIINVKTGHFLTSKVKLAEDWKWDRKTVTRFLKMLERNDMIRITSSNNGTWIFIVNYERYQGLRNSDGDNIMDSGKDSACLTNNNITNGNKYNKGMYYKKRNTFCDFEQREYDFGVIEQELLSHKQGGDCDV